MHTLTYFHSQSMYTLFKYNLCHINYSDYIDTLCILLLIDYGCEASVIKIYVEG